MISNLIALFEDSETIQKIQMKLPYLFQLAEIDNSRDGKLWMEIGSARERILIALLIYKFWEENINVDIPITRNETDVMVYGNPLSIKTLTNRKITWFKLIWTVDSQKAREFMQNYQPECDILLAQINRWWIGYLYLFDKTAQEEILEQLWREAYFKLPKEGTNPRWVEISNNAVERLVNHQTTKKIEVNRMRSETSTYKCYDRWIELWGN